MLCRLPAAVALIVTVAAVFCAPTSARDASAETLSGGPAGTTLADGEKAFSMPAPALRPTDRKAFAAGRRLFRVSWRPQSYSDATSDMVGLGPLFNRRSCAGCHVRNGRGRPPEAGGAAPARGMILRLGAQTAGAPMPDPELGAQLQDQAVPGISREGHIDSRYHERPGQFADGTAFSLRAPTYAISGSAVDHLLFLSPRVPPAVFGGGLLEAVDVSALQALADLIDEDGDGISGRLAVIDRPDGRVIGRFGWKATRPSLRDQVIEAAAEDLGLASVGRPLGACTPAQADQIAGCTQDLELEDGAIDQMVAYLRGLAAPARRNLDDPAVRRGEALFEQAGCAQCHRASLPTGDYPPLPAFGG
jgi:CxxC motif-containing protein (DUF1111 family)